MRDMNRMNSIGADEDADVFEITDFTTASDWERFIARFEEIIHEWKLANRPPLPPAPKDEYSNGAWDERTEELQFADFKFKITHKFLKSCVVTTEGRSSEEKDGAQDNDDTEDFDEKTPTVYSDLMNLDNDFPSRAHPLCRWYGLQEFLTLSPAANNEIIDTESRTKLLLSSASIAMSNTTCSVPVFVQQSHNWRKLYCGTCVVPGANVEFEMVHLKKIPSQYDHLAGLLDVFKSKLGCVYISMPPVSVSVRFTYILSDWSCTAWPQAPPDLSSLMEDEVGCSDFGNLPFGACEDPVSDLHLSCTWPSLSEDMIVENHVYSDLDPLQAPQWSVRINMVDDPLCLLGDYIREFLTLTERKETTDELLGNLVSDDGENADLSQALQRLTEPNMPYAMPSIGSVVSTATTRLKIKPEEAPIASDMLNQILLFLFPDAKGPKCEGEDENGDEEVKEKTARYIDVLAELKKQMKTAPLDSLTHRLAVCFSIVNHNYGGLRAVAHLWQEFVLEMRFRWENNHFVSGVEKCQPNLGACLLHQKLQMLNCCIERKMKRESLGYGYGSEYDNSAGASPDSPGDPFSSVSDKQDTSPAEGRVDEVIAERVGSIGSVSDDEFYDCDDDEDDDADGASVPKEKTKSDRKNSRNRDSSEDRAKLEESIESASVASESSFKDSVSHKPEGRLAPFKNMKLQGSSEQMYVPITQEPSPMTEDMLEEHADVLSKLGSSQESTQLRARMQSACLLSDMESFKAANPGCTLEDFVRWYSPRDYIEDEVETEDGKKEIKGCLSQRMQIPGNMWVEVWQSARPVPARRQRRLFDDTKEAEKVLHWLSSMKPATVVFNLMPMLTHAAIVKVLDNEDADVPAVKTLVDQIVSKGAKLTRNPMADVRKYEHLVRLIEMAETLIARTVSLRSKFSEDLLEQRGAESELHHFVSCLHQHPEVTVRGGPCGPVGAIIHKLFVQSQKASYMLLDEDEEPTEEVEKDAHKPASTVPDFPRPTAREYILRAMVPRPAPYSRVLPQKMFCVLVENDHFRLAGAFSSDTTFQ
ncbi:rab3 GTPase-activating protein catalytic subunit-like [Haliotis rufescens]|uniref:rab3 GTPase-activating protein catalytic subunit-like n=1 Tax=Haliotis rufescens TaxID=6454 RepID=UPI001EAF9072|nr:rab3 GTPase-activating protein catalytic subunit-like [Haliotis rufescens]